MKPSTLLLIGGGIVALYFLTRPKPGSECPEFYRTPDGRCAPSDMPPTIPECLNDPTHPLYPECLMVA